MSKLGWKVTALAFAVPLGFAARKAVATGWRMVRGEPPKEPGAPGVTWGEALAWAAVSGLAVAAAELVAARGAAAVWRSVTGSEPPPYLELLESESGHEMTGSDA